MVINSLSLENFRNYSSLNLCFHPKINYFYGRNGSGKTGIIEALYFITRLRSFRAPQQKQLIKYQEDLSRICSSFESKQVRRNIEIVIKNDQKKVFIDGKSLRFSSEFINSYYSSLFSSDQVYIFKNYPLFRRNLFDRICSLLSKNYFRLLQKFVRTRKQKNVCLKKGNKREIYSWNKILANLIPSITHERKKITDKINESFVSYYPNFLGKDIIPYLRYSSAFLNLKEEEIFKNINEKIDSEIQSGFMLFGPQKDNFNLINKEKNYDLSQGEYKTFVFYMQICITEIIKKNLGINSLFLFDDIFSDLDQEVSEFIANYIEKTEHQVFLTSTENKKFFGKNGLIYEIKDGKILQNPTISE